jgi:hypothetical protein
MSRSPSKSYADIDMVWSLSESTSRGCLFIGDIEAAKNLRCLKSILSLT